MHLSSAGPFLKEFLFSPRSVGAIAPSGGALAKFITSEIRPDSGPILELGPGTGVFTEALLARGVRQSDLTLVEYGSDFARLLDARFPRARVLWMDASQIGSHALFEGRAVAAVVSGIPLLNLSPKKVIAILTGCFRNMRRDAAFYQFTYGLTSPVSKTILDRLGLKATFQGRVLMNIPPASVYKITRRGAGQRYYFDNPCDG